MPDELQSPPDVATTDALAGSPDRPIDELRGVVDDSVPIDETPIAPLTQPSDTKGG
jgi:hypothetical protein